MKFIELTRKKVKTLINTSQIIAVIPNGKKSSVITSAKKGETNRVLVVDQNYASVKKLIQKT